MIDEQHNSLPVFDNPKDGLAFLDQQEQKAIAELETEAKERMALDAEDPTQQQYFLRKDKRTVIKDEKEYVWCQTHGVPLKVISYGGALEALKQEDARARKRLKEKRKKKVAKKSRKRNR